ncbi:MAG: DUF1284 domain-containing protein [Thermoguttaceae bacterium]|jgi:hypothetical protein|nr:DUF1284 domain-containing protein [Thermoguttaceae bacterium]
MNCLGDRFTGANPTRREFLKTTTTLAGSAALVSLDPGRAGRAAEGRQAPAGASGLAGPDVVTIRGHHLFDMLDALGTGKTSHTTLGPVAQRIRAQPKVPIKLVIGVDDICNPCAWWDHEKGRCTKSLDTYPQDNQNSLTSDTNAIRVLGLKPGDVVPADELYRRIKAKITKKVFAEEVCVACRLVDRCKETYEARIKAAVDVLAKPAEES